MQSEWDIKNCPHRFEFMKRGMSAMIPTKFILILFSYIKHNTLGKVITFRVIHIMLYILYKINQEFDSIFKWWSAHFSSHFVPKKMHQFEVGS